jgi:hypothetical protein
MGGGNVGTSFGNLGGGAVSNSYSDSSTGFNTGSSNSLQFRNMSTPNFSAMAAQPPSGGSAFMSALGGIGGALAAANPVIGAVSAIAGFFTSMSARRRARRQARARKRRAIKSEDLLMGAARNVVSDIKQQDLFTGRAFDIAQQKGVRSYTGSMREGNIQLGATNLAGSGSGLRQIQQMNQEFSSAQDAATLGLESDRYQLDQQKESRLRDIQSNLLELSAHSGRNMNVLDMMED